MIIFNIRCLRFLIFISIFNIITISPSLAQSLESLKYALSPVGSVSEEDVKQALNIIPDFANLEDRIMAVSSYFLHRPYSLGPAGEGEDGDLDQKPLSTWDKFDCVTFIEAVMALSLIHPRSRDHRLNLENYYDNIKLIKYHSDEISFLTRNHFTEMDWIPYLNNIGLLQDITKSIFPSAPIRTKIIDKKLWFMQKTTKDLFLPDATEEEKNEILHDFKNKVINLDFQPQDVELHYLPFHQLMNKEVQKKLPRISIFSLIRGEHPTNPHIPVMVSHQGLLIRKEDHQLYIRHASTSTMTVMDIALDDYITLRLKDTWPSLGLNLQTQLAF